jgi:hypothetical protein
MMILCSDRKTSFVMTKGMFRTVPGIVKMLTETGRRVSFIIGAMFAASATFAQEAVRVPKPTAPELTEAAETERVVVTGSYIPIPTAESEGPLPVAIYSQEQ